MAWFVLVVSGVLEAVWAIALGKSEGFSRLTPSLVFLVGLVLSMGGLAYAMRTLPIGTSYAVWVGIGASLTVAFGMATGDEAVTAGQGAAHTRAIGLRHWAQTRPLTGVRSSAVARAQCGRTVRSGNADGSQFSTATRSTQTVFSPVASTSLADTMRRVRALGAGMTTIPSASPTDTTFLPVPMTVSHKMRFSVASS